MHTYIGRTSLFSLVFLLFICMPLAIFLAHVTAQVSFISFPLRSYAIAFVCAEQVRKIDTPMQQSVPAALIISLLMYNMGG